MTCSDNTCGTGIGSVILPGDPDNNSILTALPVFGGIELTWTMPATNAFAVSYVKVWRSFTSNFNAALLIASASGDRYFDRIDFANGIFSTMYYWIQFVSVNGTVGDPIGPAAAMPKPTIEQVIEQLTAKIDYGMLSVDLKTQVDGAAVVYQDLLTEINDRISENATLSTALQLVQTGVNDAMTLIVTESTERQDGVSALAVQLNTVAAANADNTAFIEAEQTARVDAVSALALDITTLAATVDDNYSDAITAASNAQTAANTANNALSSLASDSILSPSEKPTAVREYAQITGEQTGLTAQATSYGITTEKTTYTTAITALTTYLGTLTGWNTIPGSDVVIVGTTFRTKFSDVYVAKQALLNAIVAKAKVLAGDAQTTATDAATAASNAQTAANTANSALSDIASDSKLTAPEKQIAVRDYNDILAEQTGITTQATSFGITTEKTAYTTAVTALTTYLNTLTGWNVIPGSTVDIVGATFRTKFSDVYTARQTLLNAIYAKAKTLADNAGTAASNAAAAVTTEATARANADSALSSSITSLNTATSNNASGLLDVKSSKIGYSAITSTGVPYDGDNSTIVYSATTYPTATYPEYAVNRTRIVDKVGVTNWNATPAGVLKPLSWIVGMPLASAMQTVSVTGPDGAAASLATAMTAQSTLNGSFKAMYTAKVTVTDGTTKLIGGFGIYGDATGIEAGFDVSRFWIGSTAANKRKPFIVDAGVVYIDEAAIRSASITLAKIDTASITSLSAITQSVGQINMQRPASTATFIRYGKTDVNDVTNAGFWIGVDAAGVAGVAIGGANGLFKYSASAGLQVAGQSVSVVQPGSIVTSGAVVTTYTWTNNTGLYTTFSLKMIGGGGGGASVWNTAPYSRAGSAGSSTTGTVKNSGGTTVGTYTAAGGAGGPGTQSVKPEVQYVLRTPVIISQFDGAGGGGGFQSYSGVGCGDGVPGSYTNTNITIPLGGSITVVVGDGGARNPGGNPDVGYNGYAGSFSLTVVGA